MTLDNLLQIGKLKPHKTSREEIAKLMAAVRRNLKDAHIVASARKRDSTLPTKRSCNARLSQ